MIVPDEIPELDYLQLMQSLNDYAYPRDKVTKLLRSGTLIRVRKGLYVRNDPRNPYSREILANLIFGPSYVSLEFALQHHGLIPEAVRLVTSVTTGRNKKYLTPVGSFEYCHLPQKYMSPGSEWLQADSKRGYMIASPAKAIFDILYLRTPDITRNHLEAHLFENLRMEENEFAHIDFSVLQVHLRACKRPAIQALRRYLVRRHLIG